MRSHAQILVVKSLPWLNIAEGNNTWKTWSKHMSYNNGLYPMLSEPRNASEWMHWVCGAAENGWEHTLQAPAHILQVSRDSVHREKIQIFSSCWETEDPSVLSSQCYSACALQMDTGPGQLTVCGKTNTENERKHGKNSTASWHCCDIAGHDYFFYQLIFIDFERVLIYNEWNILKEKLVLHCR